MIRRLFYGSMLMSGIITANIAFAQDDRTVYYLDINALNSNAIHNIEDPIVNLRYQDLYGDTESILLKVFNWRREEVAAYSLMKSYGVNYYNLNTHAFFSGWKKDDVYTFEVSDESQHRYTLLVRKVAPPLKEKPVVSIFVNPLHVACQDLGGNMVEFYGTISGGTPPYTIQWFVLNDQRTELLYQPKEAVIIHSGNTPVIRVDKNPDYHVLLHVRDACGMEQEQVVNLVCQRDGKKVHTLFLEPVQTLPKHPNAIK